jgi:hypothetical protein
VFNSTGCPPWQVAAWPARRACVGRNGRGVGLSSPKSSAVGCLERLAGGLLRSDLEGVEAVVVLDGADPEGVKATQYLLTPLMRTTDESLGPDWLVPVAG